MTEVAERLKSKRYLSDLSYFNCKSYTENDGVLNHLIFERIYNTFIRPAGDNETIVAWKSKGLSEEIIKLPTAPFNIFSAKLK